MTLWTLFVGLAWAAPQPQCLATADAPHLESHARKAVEHLGMPWPVVVNPASPREDALELYLLSDEEQVGCFPVDAASICEAKADRIECSAAAIAATLTEAKQHDHPSMALLLVLAHELGHVHARHPSGSFDSNGCAAGDRNCALRAALHSWDADKTREAEADAYGYRAMAAVMSDPVFVGDGPGVMAGLYIAELTLVQEGRNEAAKAAGNPVEAGYPDSLPASAEDAQRWAERLHCDGGTLPALGGTHPRWNDRLARGLETICGKRPASTGNAIADLALAWCDIQRFSYQEMARFDAAVVLALKARIEAGITCP